jgi:hypothetical protein
VDFGQAVHGHGKSLPGSVAVSSKGPTRHIAPGGGSAAR